MLARRERRGIAFEAALGAPDGGEQLGQELGGDRGLARGGGSDRAQQLVGGLVLGDEAGAARFDRLGEHRGVGVAGEHHELRPWVRVADSDRGGGAVVVGEVVVEEHDVGSVLERRVDCLLGTAGEADDPHVGLVAQHPHEALGEHLVVVDHQDSDHREWKLSPSGA